MKEETREQIMKDLFLIIAGAFAGALISMLITNASAHEKIVKNVRIIDCINAATALTLVKGENMSDWEWNIRYITDYYNSNWDEIGKEFGSSTFRYVSAVKSMEAANNLIGRAETRIDLSKEARGYLFTSIASSSKATLNTLNKIYRTPKECNELIGPFFTSNLDNFQYEF